MTYTSNRRHPDDITRYRRRRGEQPVASRYARDAYTGRRSEQGPQSGYVLGDILAGGNKGEQGGPHRGHEAKGAAKPQDFKTKLKRVLKGVLIGMLVFLVVAAAWLYSLNKTMQMNDSALDAALTGETSLISPYYILITGSDARENESSRTDTIILARIDPIKNQVTLISIPRDTRIYLSGYGYQKINAAHAYGGAALTVQAVEDFAGVDIAHYIEVDFSGFSDIVDAVGGVTVDVPADTVVDDIALPEGTQTLNGEQALVFVRCRETYLLGDFQRTANQRQFMTALASGIKHAPFYKWPSIFSSIASCVSTDMSSYSMLWMIMSLSGLDPDTMYTAVVPSTTSTIGGVSYVITIDDEWTQMMALVDAGKDPNA
jgi:polyisoprenyl-teichoic acid--peptidoglycan teichoic acid transferase